MEGKEGEKEGREKSKRRKEKGDRERVRERLGGGRAYGTEP